MNFLYGGIFVPLLLYNCECDKLIHDANGSSASASDFPTRSSVVPYNLIINANVRSKIQLPKIVSNMNTVNYDNFYCVFATLKDAWYKEVHPYATYCNATVSNDRVTTGKSVMLENLEIENQGEHVFAFDADNVHENWVFGTSDAAKLDIVIIEQTHVYPEIKLSSKFSKGIFDYKYILETIRKELGSTDRIWTASVNLRKSLPEI